MTTDLSHEYTSQFYDAAYGAVSTLQRFVTVTRDRVRQVIDVTMRYVETAPTKETTVRFTMRWYWRYELEHLLQRAGFTEVTIYGAFDRRPVGPDSPAYVVLAR